MHSPSFAWKDLGIVIDADIRFSSGLILEQFPPGKKAIEEEMCKTENRGRDQCCSGSVSLYADDQGAIIKKRIMSIGEKDDIG